MTRIVISERFGGFGLSLLAEEKLRARGWDETHTRDIARDHPDLVAVVQELGSAAASGRFAELHVVDIPDDVKWHIYQYDGAETIHEDHRSWGSTGLSDYC